MCPTLESASIGRYPRFEEDGVEFWLGYSGPVGGETPNAVAVIFSMDACKGFIQIDRLTLYKMGGAFRNSR